MSRETNFFSAVKWLCDVAYHADVRSYRFTEPAKGTGYTISSVFLSFRPALYKCRMCQTCTARHHRCAALQTYELLLVTRELSCHDGRSRRAWQSTRSAFCAIYITFVSSTFVSFGGATVVVHCLGRSVKV